MTNRRFFHKNNYNPNRYPDAFKSVASFIPIQTMRKLEEISEKKAIPISRLVAIAIDNELDAKDPFYYSSEIPKIDTSPYQYTDEGGKILAFLDKFFPKGASLDSLLLCRRDLGVENRDVLLLAYREILLLGLIEEFRPVRTQFAYGRDYKRARVVKPEAEKKRRKGRSYGDES